MRRTALALGMLAGLLSACATGTGAGPQAFSPRPAFPRVAPVDQDNLTEAQRDMLASRSTLNIYLTLANHVDLYNRWSPLGQFILNGSSIQPRHREMAMLRMGWLCQSEYEWAQHARIAKGAPGLKDAEIHAIAEGPSAAVWSETDRAVLNMADELRYDAMVSDATWASLSKVYSPSQIMELVYTASQYQLVSMALNSLGVQLEPTAAEHFPTDVRKPAPAARVTSPRATAPRIKPIPLATMAPWQREMVAGQIQPDGTLMNLYATIANNPKLYGPRARFGSYLQRDSMLDPETRELTIMRTAYLIDASYEWAHHFASAKSAGLTEAQIADIAKGPDAPGWSEKQRAVLQAVDELRREAFVSDRTWKTLGGYYNMKERIEIIYTSGGYTMTGVAINSFGIETEPGYPAMPR
ncbi:MAG TPA: carboxymuconolactone decarboxylase family protein [Hyphomonadaceae bacterium]|nr:carboxymuconolactone decarboxylase family protein [Hyphomonadaceae bacterium]